MKRSNHSELDDFLEDDSFRLWIFGKATPEAAQQWDDFLLLYPQKEVTFRKAQEVLRAIEGDTFALPAASVRHNIRQIMQDTEPTPFIQSIPWHHSPVWRWAAAAVVVLAVTWYSWHRNQQALPPSTAIYRQMVSAAAAPLEEVVNETTQSRLVLLADGSSVVLQPNSRISYPKQFDQHPKREVYLTGEAFFEVAKNPDKPFFVYADNLIAKVLGTSFTVRAYDRQAVDVTVKTGKVSVFTRFDKERVEKKESKQLIGLVLTPNQRGLFDREEGRLLRSLVESPNLLDMPIQRSVFEFNDTPVSAVFASLEKAYGVEIIFDAEVMKNCYLTASLDDEPLFEKLNMICQTLDAQHEQMDGKILISSKGCQ
ncbi:FecR family protein [Spirosoma linguale]|uniref:Anti-FecI sigma factor, FecR n=1 Tax=Spirosoma linguale (strain ATCC 33905 / DSM 74 / LMG 10896 / Claus 1) TaxID=504472 RepID=D2QSI2_SPILD|nr:anti-FecI sigma factor, FecR [Spirosoma linguale DSM 74]